MAPHRTATGHLGFNGLKDACNIELHCARVACHSVSDTVYNVLHPFDFVRNLFHLL